MGIFWTVMIATQMWLSPIGSGAQFPLASIQETQSPEVVLHLKPALVSGNSVKIPYEIPYPGYIEFHLFDPAGEKIWVGTSVQEKGEHVQALRRDKMEEGQTYTFDIWYKGKKYSGRFTNS